MDKVNKKAQETKLEETKASSASATKVVEVKTEKKSSQNTNNKQQRARKGSSRNTKPVKDEFEEKVIDIARVVKVVKGGRNFSFSAFVVVGNKKGKVGYGHGKAKEVPDAIKKAVKDAKNHLVDVPLIKDSTTIPHEITEKFLASKVILKPAPKGKGIIASGSVRAVIELAGYHDIVTKTYGSRTKANVVKATLKALRELRTPEEIAALRDKKVSDII
ncbi:30S ribosomal protein S5 [Mycoplasma phocimorsus]|uniref:30S ribosomal protein S5 n=1 Tax=Mycoplasma phocimorsus TaxID=3045839 RepID=UPI003D2FCAD1